MGPTRAIATHWLPSGAMACANSEAATLAFVEQLSELAEAQEKAQQQAEEGAAQQAREQAGQPRNRWC